ncbi:MAG TPA: histidine--tRNA ligase [Candidatus Paceibacterota bacterium]|nr:histidine--tRNA ligase [Candidatus Paceibacterota bacterium]
MADLPPLSTEPYKGTRDFYPEDMFVLNHILGAMRTVSERFGYLEYGASPLESTELYKAKSGEEIVNEQTYTFTDRGGREVTLRPEMTPTVARMVAGKRRELAFPLRWYSIPNLFRYEQPQRGRLREHYQLNVDIFGVEGSEAEIEVISVAAGIMQTLGARDEDFTILLNHRGLMNAMMAELGLSEEQGRKLSKLIDRKNKMEASAWSAVAKEIAGEAAATAEKALASEDLGTFLEHLPALAAHPAVTELEEVLRGLAVSGVRNVRFDPSLMRGFDYYTGVVFELFDTAPENRRALFGGGRYDDLLSIFGADKLPAVGFGMGDVALRDFLEVHGLLPDYRPATRLYICRADGAPSEAIMALAAELRREGVNTAVDFTSRKLGDQIGSADKQRIPYVLVVGERELESGTFAVKELATGTETSLSREELPAFFR